MLSRSQVAGLRAQAETAMRSRHWQAAGDALRKLLVAFPGHPEVLTQLSYTESLLGHYRSAREFAIAASGSPSDDVEVVADTMARLRTFNAARELKDYLRRLGPPARLPIPVLLNAGAQLSYLNEQSAAFRYLDEAVRADPSYPPALLSHAQVSMYENRLADAARDIDRVLARAPEIAAAYWIQAQLSKQTADSNHVDAIRRQLARPARKPDEVVHLAYALHKELDDLGDHDGAWAALEQACAAKRCTLKYDRQQSRDLVDALIALDAGTPVGPTDAAHVPVFIVGMHRSGTTLLEQLLDASPEVKGVGELYDFTSAMRWVTDHHCQQVIDAQIVRRAPQADLAEAGRRYLAGMQWRLGEERLFTDKLPSNFLNIGFICQALPQAKILHMVRDPVETCFSNLRELFSSANPYSYDQAELADFYLQYRRLMAHWHAAYPGRILDVDYRCLTRDPETVMREVAAFCGIGYVDAMRDTRSSSRAVATASAVQVREGVIAREVPKWAPYAHKLSPLIEALRAGGVEAG